MSIISSTIAQITLNGDGLVAVREEHIFHNGISRNYRYNGVNDADHTLQLTDHVVMVETKERRRESGNFTEHLLQGLSPASFDRQHNSAGALIRPLLRAFMSIDDPAQVLKMARWIKDNLSDAQLDAKVPIATRQKIRSRIINLMTMEAALEADSSYIIEVPE